MKIKALQSLNYKGDHVEAGHVFEAEAHFVPDLKASGRAQLATDEPTTWANGAPVKAGKKE
jgi:hypothetical protein